MSLESPRPESIDAGQRAAPARLIKRKAVITVEYEALDNFDVRAQESEIRRVLSDLQPRFDRLDVRFQDRRPRSVPRAAAPDRIWTRDRRTS